ncbi:MAG: YceI family protein [Acidimicrobiia bacterium]
MKKIVIPILIVLILGSVAVWYFAIRDENLKVSNKNIDKSKTDQSIQEKSTADGNWKIKQQSDVFAGYEIEEIFAGNTTKKTASGKSKAVTGSFTISGSTLSDTRVTLDTTKLESDSSRRDSEMQTSGLETDAFPEAIFKQTSPASIVQDIIKNKEMTINVEGDLTLHGETNNIVIALDAIWDGKTITVSGELEISLADYKILPPDNGFTKVDDSGKLKLQLLFVPA